MPPYEIDSVYVFSFILFIQRVLSVVWSGGKLGSAYYDTETSQMYLQMDVIETNDFQFLKRGNFFRPVKKNYPFASECLVYSITVIKLIVLFGLVE